MSSDRPEVDRTVAGPFVAAIRFEVGGPSGSGVTGSELPAP
ncbi:MAG: hypothetical protein JWQ99_3423 [Blastococcus sp.]|jgi:hypothetical protein|nr:hypothetical protein [Blastococcus sp.]